MKPEELIAQGFEPVEEPAAGGAPEGEGWEVVDEGAPEVPAERESARQFAANSTEGKTDASTRRLLSDGEVRAISARSGVAPERIKELAPWAGATPDQPEWTTAVGDAFKAAAAGLDEIVTGGVVGGVISKATLPENEQRAMDDVRALIRAKTPGVQLALETAAGVVLPAGPVAKGIGAAVTAAKTLPKAGKAAAYAAGVAGGSAAGAGIGAATAETGEELEGAKMGAAFGAVVSGAVVPIASAFVRKVGQEWDAARKFAEQEDEALLSRARKMAEDEKKTDDALWSVLNNAEHRTAIREGRAKQVAAELPDDVQREIFTMKKGNATEDPHDDIAEVLTEELNFLEHRAGRAAKSGVTTESIAAMESPSPKAAAEGVKDYSEELFRDGRNVDRMVRAMADNTEGSRGESTGFQRLFGYLADARYKAKRIDDRYNTAVEVEIDRLSAGTNKAQTEAATFMQLANVPVRLSRRARKAGYAQEDIYRLLDSPEGATIDTIRGSSAPAEVKEAAIHWRALYDTVVGRAQSLGLKIEHLAKKSDVGAPGSGLSFTPHPIHAKNPDDFETVDIDVKRLDDLWSKDQNLHIDGAGKGAIGQRLTQAKDFVKSGKPIEQPMLSLGKGGVTFSDGRHRFAALRDSGVRSIPVSVPRDEAARIRSELGADSVGGERLGYVPNQTVAPSEFAARIGEKAEELGLSVTKKGEVTGDLQKILDRAAADANSEEGQFVRALHLGDQNGPKTTAELRDAIVSSFDPVRSTERLQKYARAAMERGNEKIPDFVREKDLGRLFDSWVNNTFSHIHTRDAAQRLTQFADVLGRVGAKNQDKIGAGFESLAAKDAEWIRNLVADVGGTRATSKWGNVRLKASRWERDRRLAAKADLRAADEAKAKGQDFLSKALKFRAAAREATSNPLEATSKLTAWMYPAYLGAKTFSAVRNLTQWVGVALPELGGTYGMEVAQRSLKDLVANRQKYQGLLEKEGLAPPQQLFEAQDYVRNGIMQNPAMRKISWAGRGISEIAMFAYTKADQMNRILTAASANVLADDVMKAVGKMKDGVPLSPGERRAAAFVRQLGSGYRNEVRRAIEAGRPDEVGELLRAYMNGKTQFNYNRASMSEFGRDMGPFFAMFSKWPTSVGAEVYDLFKPSSGDASTDALRRSQLAQKWLWPLAVLASAEAVVRNSGIRESDPRSELLLGTSRNATSGLGSMHPLSALTGPMSGRMLPPLISEPLGVAEKLRQGQYEKAGKAAAKALLNLTPGGVFYNFAETELPRFLNEKKEAE